MMIRQKRGKERADKRKEREGDSDAGDDRAAIHKCVKFAYIAVRRITPPHLTPVHVSARSTAQNRLPDRG
ncbi:MAG: hypothetical protein LBB48_04495 [Treponema sp.]|nr:hypothetical protein [Treponema sp.]